MSPAPLALVRCLRVETSATDGADHPLAVHGLPLTSARRTRAYGLALTALLHLAVVALLYWRAPPKVEHPTATPSLVMLKLPSVVPQPERAAMPPPAAKPAPAKPRKPRPPTNVAAAPRVEAPVEMRTPAVDVAPAAPSLDPAASGPGTTQAAAAPPPDASADTPPPIEYLRRISRMISRAQLYPWSARQYGHQGDAIVRMHLSRDGTVRTVTLIRSSGHSALDVEACDVIWRIGRFPPFPFDYRPRIAEFDIDQPISFRRYLN